ncbi:MAG: FkbM family methyltransferase, partial [Oscillospiraceae bacterium]|nr:FkbM family methyltransferase [Oscillospiraceae bacterium]
MTDRTTDIWEKLARCEKPVVLYGTGDGAEKILERLEARGIEAAGIFASDGFVRPGRTFRGLGVVSYAEAAKRFGDMCVLVCFGSDRPEVIGNIKRIAAEQELYMPDVPVCGGGTFDAEYYEAHREELAQVRALLADEESRRCLDEVIEYKLSGEIEHLFACESGAEGL